VKRLLFLVVTLAAIGELLPAQETAAPPRKRWFEYLHGLSISAETGSHEYPLENWYPGGYIEGYSVRSFYLKPELSYSRAIKEFSFTLLTDLVMDMGAPDPGPGAQALNAKNADRRDWYTVHIEEDFHYMVNHLLGGVKFPGDVEVFLTHENYIYAAPEFPGGKIADGNIEFGLFGFTMDTRAGSFTGKLGLPLYYLYRFDDGIGFGMNVTFGYKVFFDLGLDITSRSLFVPQAKQAETEFLLHYDWPNFSARVKCIAMGSFTSATIHPELEYHYKKLWTFTLGVEITDVGRLAAFSPSIRLRWKY
jgi:hypothetical protein